MQNTFLLSFGYRLEANNTMNDRLSPNMHTGGPQFLETLEDVSNDSTVTRVKQKVKSHVLKERRKRGLSDVEIDEERPRVKQELNPHELEKRERRKAQNRRAAEKCRKKKQLENQELAKSYDEEIQKNKALIEENHCLKQEKAQLERTLEEHQFTCQLCVNQSPNNTPGFENQMHFSFDGLACNNGYPVFEQLGIPRDTTTPFQREEPEPDVFTTELYPSFFGVEYIKPEVNCNAPSCAAEPLLSLPDLGDIVDILNPLSPEQFSHLGRQSISD
ncbi:fos-related antigen 2-like isoform X4 [Dreissena polymorpha]|uniref:fos-related antigen 2-like isoform X4 n=1 Tax=Dreissena polymorpha TaxID=45954 RepID=UPI0022645901|nr:fos-related antigen 2-like isoform X4 [Dreissena polymorpha]